jgi:hypothetical protein
VTQKVKNCQGDDDDPAALQALIHDPTPLHRQLITTPVQRVRLCAWHNHWMHVAGSQLDRDWRKYQNFWA